MEIIGLILVLVVAAAFGIWRIHGYIQAGRSVVETARDLKEEFERQRWRHESGRPPAAEEEGPAGRGINPRQVVEREEP